MFPNTIIGWIQIALQACKCWAHQVLFKHAKDVGLLTLLFVSWGMLHKKVQRGRFYKAVASWLPNISWHEFVLDSFKTSESLHEINFHL